MSLDVLQFLKDLVWSQNLSVNNPNLIEVATLVQRVKTELDAEIEAIAEASA